MAKKKSAMYYIVAIITGLLLALNLYNLSVYLFDDPRVWSYKGAVITAIKETAPPAIDPLAVIVISVSIILLSVFLYCFIKQKKQIKELEDSVNKWCDCRTTGKYN